MYFLKLLLINLTFLVSSVTWAHSSHLITVSSQASTQKPENLGASSIELLEKDIDIVGGYGKGYYFEQPQNKSQELVNQGFAMLNLFQWTDAFRSFSSASKLNKDLVIAQVGRGLSAVNLDGKNRYFLDITLNFLKQQNLSGTDKSWAQIFTSLVIGQDLSGKSLMPAQAYQNLKKQAPNNLETLTLANWITNAYDTDDLEQALKIDEKNAGALHYLLHLAEFKNDHDRALGFGERLIKVATDSGHAQHMYGHVLPHFNRWNEADRQFAISDKIHKDWGIANSVSPAEDWHYMHNLDLWSVTKMVLEPSAALGILAEIQSLNPGAILDFIDFAAASFPLNEDGKNRIESFISPFESYSMDYRAYALSSRLYFDIVYSPSQEVLTTAVQEVQKSGGFKNKQLLQVFLTIMQANQNQDIAALKKVTDYMLESLTTNFEKGGFDGWKASVLEALMYQRLFQVYGLSDVEARLQKEVLDRYMSPID